MSESLSQKREEFSKKKFKQTVHDLLVLLRHAADLETAALYWVNRFRSQYVLERFTSRHRATAFVDRLDFGSYFLDGYRDITAPVKLEIGRDVLPAEIAHYHGDDTAKFVILVPFVNNGETIAVTLLESKFNTFTEEEQGSLQAYNSALANVLHTYTELTDLSEEESGWTGYERVLNQIEQQRSEPARIQQVLEALMADLTAGTVTFLVRGTAGWTVLMNAPGSFHAVAPGSPLHRSTLGHEALTVGAPSFSTHNAGNPKRVSPFEPAAEGATLAVPMMLSDRRMGLWVIHDTNPMSFKESNRHKWTNLIRLLSYQLMQFRPKQEIEEYFSQKFGLLNTEAMDLALGNLIRLSQKARSTQFFGLVTLADLPGWRAKLSVEVLSELQQELLKRIEPGRYSMNGLFGFHADYVYSFILSGEKTSDLDVWREKVEFELRRPFELSDGSRPVVKLHLAAVPLAGNYAEPYEVTTAAKQALNNLMRTQKLSLNRP